MVSKRRRASAVAACGLCVVLTACNNSEPKRAHQPQSSAPPATAVAGPDGVQRVTIDVSDALRFVPAEIVMKPGKLVVSVQNKGAVPHTFDVKSLSESSGAIDGHALKSITLTANQPGRYQIICAFHVAEGMVATLVVQG